MDAEKMALIQRIDNMLKHNDYLHKQLAKVERERDVLRYDMQRVAFGLCEICRYNNPDEEVCSRSERVGKNCFVWRGVCAENGGVANG